MYKKITKENIGQYFADFSQEIKKLNEIIFGVICKRYFELFVNVQIVTVFKSKGK